MSYLRSSCFITEPSPTQLPEGMPANMTTLPSRNTELTLSKPSATPIQVLAGSPRWATTQPAPTQLSRISDATRSRKAGGKASSQLKSCSTRCSERCACLPVRVVVAMPDARLCRYWQLKLAASPVGPLPL